MPFYRGQIYPRLVNSLGDPPPIREIRRKMIPLAEGTVLEIGAGSGANFVHYDPPKVSYLYALEPNTGMVRLAKKNQRQTHLNIEYLDLMDGRIPLSDHTVDTVVSTFTLCTIADLATALRELARVLKPEGRLIFFELGLSPDVAIQRWQKLLEPVSRWVFQGLYLTRDIPPVISQAGFQLQEMGSGYLARFPKSLSYCWWGTATWLPAAG